MSDNRRTIEETLAAARSDSQSSHELRDKNRRKPFDPNRTVIELLDDPDVRERYRNLHLFFGPIDGFKSFVAYLSGYDAALQDFVPSKSLFDGFYEWLRMHFDDGASTPWEYFISTRYGEGPEAILKFFELWDAFRNDRDENGLDAFLEKHREYEIKRYGAPVTPRHFDKHK